MKRYICMLLLSLWDISQANPFRQGMHLLDETNARVHVAATLAGKIDSPLSDFYLLETSAETSTHLYDRRTFSESKLVGLASSLSNEVSSWGFSEQANVMNLNALTPVLSKSRAALSLPMSRGIDTVLLKANTANKLRQLIINRLRRSNEKLSLRASRYIAQNPKSGKDSFERFLISHARPMHLYSDMEGRPTNPRASFLFQLINLYFPED